jgi:hypothetical protein
MVNPQFAGIKPTMVICGNDAGAKETVTPILDQFGLETEDMGQSRRPAPSNCSAGSGRSAISWRTKSTTHLSCGADIP